MTNHLARLYALVAAVFVFFVAWAAIAAHPWQTQKAAAQDPRLAALQLREQRLRAEALAVKQVLNKRWAVYRAQLALRKQEISALRPRTRRRGPRRWHRRRLPRPRAWAPLPRRPSASSPSRR